MTAGGVALPLAGFRVGAGDGGGERPPEVDAAVRALSALGAEIGGGVAGPAATLVRHPVTTELVGVPEGTVEHASGLALAAGALAACAGGTPITVPAVDVAVQVLLPEVMAAAYGSPSWPVPPAPVPAPGGGWVSAEVGASGDGERLAVLMETLPADVDAAALARAAQEWRLAVCDYRTATRTPPTSHAGSIRRGSGEEAPSHRVSITWDGAGPGGSSARPAGSRPGNGAATTPLGGVRVVDLTAMWAGPLCTWLLARLGAEVWKVEPAVRPDGLRAFDGRGVHPEGRADGSGRDSALFNALNTGKHGVDIDLREGEGRRHLAELVGMSDLVVDSFSPRVMPNLGLTRAELARSDPCLLTLSIPAFPPGPQREWVAYGTGIHAASGLGYLGGPGDIGAPGEVGASGGVGTGTVPFAAPAVTYPDPLSGLAAAVTALAGLVGRRRGWRPRHLEVSLLSAITPLLAVDRNPARLTGRAEGQGADLARAAAPDTFAPVDVAGRPFPHPVGPFRGLDVALAPPPGPPSDAAPSRP
ncbi:MAG TPA: CoA transferase [Acidimicrobiales bacterium]|nr:CoA transferase [Acidimicrobiales bacterium]